MLASAVIALARETGWSEAFILEELPFARLLLYQQALLHAKGAWIVPASESVSDQAAALGL